METRKPTDIEHILSKINYEKKRCCRLQAEMFLALIVVISLDLVFMYSMKEGDDLGSFFVVWVVFFTVSILALEIYIRFIRSRKHISDKLLKEMILCLEVPPSVVNRINKSIILEEGIRIKDAEKLLKRSAKNKIRKKILKEYDEVDLKRIVRIRKELENELKGIPEEDY